jgi:excisionase family DNA binding protein
VSERLLDVRVPRVALRVEEAAAALGVSDDFFREHVADELRWVRRGRLKVVPVSELERWLEANAHRTLED